MSDYQLQRISQSQRTRFIAAWENSFSRTLDSGIYNWIFDGKNILYALVFDGEISAGYCLYPLPCMINGQIKSALLCNNVFVSPQHQGKQLFVRIGKLSLTNAAENGEGILAYGIPNKLALPGHKRVGWDVRTPIAFLESIRKSATSPLGANWTWNVLNEQMRSDIEKCSTLSAIGRDFSIIKTAQFVQWRYESKPSAKYWFGFKYHMHQLLAYCVCKYFEEGHVLHFIDIDGVDENAVSQLIDESQSIPEKFDKLNIWESSIHRQLFVNKGYQASDITNSLIFIDPSKLAPFDIGGNINIVLGDNDVF
jgi:hypothetical protein